MITIEAPYLADTEPGKRQSETVVVVVEVITLFPVLKYKMN